MLAGGRLAKGVVQDLELNDALLLLQFGNVVSGHLVIEESRLYARMYSLYTCVHSCVCRKRLYFTVMVQQLDYEES